ncbi:MAG: hypothetical protein K0U98_08965 [Deltaproteobacteria bacterium]|nr:hypothetical protein [Deltaproteobacteria bacterium]
MFCLLFCATLFLSAQAVELEAASFLLVVNSENPVDGLPREEVRQMYRKLETKWEDWPKGPRVEVVGQKIEAEVRAAFHARIHGEKISLSHLRSFWERERYSGRAVKPKEYGSDEEVMKFVARTPGGIGYVTVGAKLRKGVKALKPVD